MATKRDLVEAHAFSRRRLVTAFVSGAPGGREVEPVRPGRTIVGGLALSVLLVLGAVIAGVFAPRTPEDWNKVGLVVSKDDGGLYVVTEQSDHPVLRPVINVTSAKLILGDLATDPTPLSSSFIQSQHIAEDVGIKSTLFENLDDICKPGAILATTTSSLPIIALAKVTKRPQDVIGMHFFNPAPIMRLVEVVSTVATADDVAETVLALCAQVGKVAVSCGDRAGFIVNALLFPYLNDAVKMLEANYATADDIDTAMKTGCGYPMGPFELLDVVGLDVSLAIQRTLYLEFREPGFAPAPRLEHLVTAGYLGKKVGRGFRSYDA